MNPSRWVVMAASLLALSLIVTGCSLLEPAVRLFGDATPTPEPIIVVQDVVVTPGATDEGRVIGAATREQPAPVTIEIAPDADVETAIYTAVYEKVNPSVVYVENLTRVPVSNDSDEVLPESQGSGFVWDSDGYIVTNQHVVAGADELLVRFSDYTTLPAELIGADADSDLAVIKVDPDLASLTPAELGDIASVQVGQRAIAIGNPFGYAGTMTTGIVSAIGRSVESATGYNIPLSIQTDAAINPGNSGGPLLNERGQVIGVNFQIRSAAASSSGVGFAIPVNIVQRVVPALIQDGVYKHAWLGISGNTYSPAWSEALGFPVDARGAYVMTVRLGGPADEGGLRPATEDTSIVLTIGMAGPEYLQSGGDLIIGVDEFPVRTFDDLLVYLESYRSPGDVIRMKVLRPGDGELTLTITLGERPGLSQ